jgi:hypothetical protein
MKALEIGKREVGNMIGDFNHLLFRSFQLRPTLKAPLEVKFCWVFRA